MSLPTISVVVPALNEEENILNLAKEILAASRSCPIREVIFVDDCSTDNTLGVLRDLKALWAQTPDNPSLRIVHHAKRSRQSTAMLNGVRAATGDVIVTMDGDGQNDPADVPRLYQEFIKDPTLGMIAGQRKHRQDSWSKRFSSKIANRVRRALLNDGVRDTGCSLKLMPRSVYLSLPYFDHMHRFLPALVIRAGYRIATVDVNHRPRVAGVSKYNLWNRLWVGIVDLLGVMWLCSRTQNPGHIDVI